MRELFRTLPLMCVVLLVPVLPFLFFGGHFEDWLRGMAENPPPAEVTFSLVVGLLATDIFLPIPSSVVATMGGWQLGGVLGTCASWLGLNVGAAIGFALARRWGQPFARWFSKDEDLDRMRTISERFGPLVLVLTRAMPVFAEASILIAGIHKLSWRRFLPAVLLSNLGIAIAYSALGDYAEQHQWLPLALAVAVAVPVIVAAVAQRFMPQVDRDHEQFAAESDTSSDG